MNAAPSFQLEVPVSAEWSHVELLRTAVQNCLAAVLRDHSRSNTMAMVASELLENAVKYGDWSHDNQTAFRIRVSSEAQQDSSELGDKTTVSVRISNPVDCDSQDTKRLLEMVDYIRRFPSPADAYHARLSEIIRQPYHQHPGSQRSGLGLVRIAYEGNCALRAHVDNDSILHIEAQSTDDCDVPTCPPPTGSWSPPPSPLQE